MITATTTNIDRASRAESERTPAAYAALSRQFPDLVVSELSVSELTDLELVTAEWDEWRATQPQTLAASGRLDVVVALMPHLRGFLSPAVPIWERSDLTSGDGAPHGWHAARQLEGRPLRPEIITDQNRERLVRDLATLLHELHGFSVERARALGLGPAREWRADHEALRQRSLAVLRPRLRWSDYTWAKRWWRTFLDDQSLWSYEPTLVHNALCSDYLLVDHFVQQVVGVEHWYQARIGDPAIDFGCLVEAYGADLGWRIVEQYGELGSNADAALFRRVRLMLTARRFQAVVRVSEDESAEEQQLVEAIAALRE